MQKTFELFRRDQLPEQSLLYIRRQWLLMHELAANLFANPLLFFFILNVPVLDTDLAAVSVLENVEDLAQGRAFAVRKTIGDENSIEVPDRQAVIFDIQFRVIKDRKRVKRICVGDQMSAHAIRVNQLDHFRFLECLLANLIAGQEKRIAIETPAQRRVRNAEVQKDVFVKVVLAGDEVVHTREKRSRLSALDDSMIVGAADRDGFANAELRKCLGCHRLILCRVFDRTRCDNH